MADKEEIRSRNDVVELIGSYVQLRRRGRNWVGLCPFHQEKTPSFNVDPVTQSFKCFGCGVSGDVFSFVERYENMSFVDAAEFLARRAGLTFERKGDSGAPAGERERLHAANATALEWFRRMLERAQVAKDYVRNRGLAHETIQRFQLGYAPDSWDGLSSYLMSRRHDMRAAETAGLVRRGQTGEFYDVFRHRVMFPIHDEQERIVGFGGRAFGDEQPKYLNTGETPVFAKGRLLYGLPFARRKIAADGRALLMEGYMDVIAAHQAGFSSAIATLGTSLTDDHAQKLARMAPVTVLVYDADSAGIKATLRASETLEKQGVQVMVARLPIGDDPDSLLKRGDVAGFQQAIDGAVGRVEYQLERIIAGADKASEAGRALMLRQIVAILASVPTRAERDVYVAKVWLYHPMSEHSPHVATEQLHRDAEAYAARVYGTRRGQPPARSSRTGSAQNDGRAHAPQGPVAPSSALTAEERAERELMRALVHPDLRSHVLRHASAEDFASDLVRRFYEFVGSHPETAHAEEQELVRLLGTTGDDEFASAVRERLQEFHALMANAPVTEAGIEDCIGRLRQRRIRLLTEELEGLYAGKVDLTAEEQERVRECHGLLRELKGSSDAT